VTNNQTPSPSSRPVTVGCGRADLKWWSDTGGPLPVGLAAHLSSCRLCADHTRRMSVVHAGLMLLRTQTAPLDLSSRANARALRVMRRTARASQAAKRLLRMKPGLNRWQRAQICLARISLGAAAASLLLMARVGLLTGLEHTRETGQILAAKHWERHVDPGGLFMGPRSFT
jgi:hypothetical protein